MTGNVNAHPPPRRRHGEPRPLALPTALLSSAPDLATFAALRIAQGVLMATAFSLTLAHLAEVTSGAATSTVFAAYITGNVASNLVGRLVSASIADGAGVATSFLPFAGINLAGAVLGWTTLTRMSPSPSADAAACVLSRWMAAPGDRLR